MAIDYKEMFSKFPVIESQFDMVSIDCIRMSEGMDQFYVPIIRYMIRNHDAKKVDGGLTLITGSTCSTLEDVAEFISNISSAGFFLVPISATGTVYTENMDEIDDVNWNSIASMTEQYEIEDAPSGAAPINKQYLH